MKSDLVPLLAAQLSAPIARIVFALVLVPLHPNGADLILILALAELLSTFLTCGRNYLLASGFNHHLTTKWLDKLVVVPLTVAGFFLLATDAQKEFWSGVVVMTVAITTMTMGNAFFLNSRKLAYILPLNIFVYVLATFATSYSIAHALVALVAWTVIENLIPGGQTVTRSRALPVLATLLAFASQRIDVQISASTGSVDFLEDVFQLNTLFMALAVLVRLIGNTALLRGRRLLDGSPIVRGLVIGIGAAYGVFLYAAGLWLENSTIVGNIAILGLTTVLSSLTITYRESIAIKSRGGDFVPLFVFSVIGIAPALIYMSITEFTGSPGPEVFLLALYLAPRVLMFAYGWLFLKVDAR